MASELTAAILAELKAAVDRHPLENITFVWGWLPALIAAAERAEVQDRIIAGEGADSDSAMACLMYSAMAGKDGWNSIAPQHVERMLARIEKFKKRADAAEKRVRELEEALKEIGRCDLGPSSADHLIGFRAAALARTALGKEPRPTIYNKIFCPKCEADMILSANNIWKCPNCEEPRP